MLFKVLDKYSKITANNENRQNEQNKIIESYDKEIIKNFLELYDKDVKKIHNNEVKIDQNLQELYNISSDIEKITKDGLNMYDQLLEYFKEAGDLYNFCTILEKEMDNIQKEFFPQTEKKEEENNKNNTNNNNDNVNNENK
jgi:hypothetical protein